MGIVSRIERRFAFGSTGATDDKWYHPGGFFYGGGGGVKTKSGSHVSEFNAMQLSVVWCCIKTLAEDSASLPLHLYRRLPNGGKEKATDHPLYMLMHDQPNPEMTSMQFRETFAAHLLSWGNGYAEKEYGKGWIGRTQVIALWPIGPHRVTPFRDERRQLFYRITMPAGRQNVILPRRQILHAPGLSYDGIIGYSPIAAARESIGLGMSLEEYGELYFGNGTHPGGIVEHPNKLGPEGHKNLRESLAETYSGLGKAHRLMLLEDGMKFQKIGIPNDEAQFLESRKFQNVDIGSRIYRLPPQMYGEYDKASTYASAEQFSIDYVTRTLRSWLVRLEQAYNMALLTEDERKEYYFEHNLEGLLRGDSAARADFYQKLFAIGGITPNIIAELENWNPIGPEGDKRFVPLNMIPLEEAGRPQETTPKDNKNRSLYRSRLQSAYLRVVTEAVGRVTRKEAQRVNYLLKNNGNVDEFYRELPEYIRKQTISAFSSYIEAITGMESELNGAEYDEFKAEIDRFAEVFSRSFAGNYIKTSTELLQPDKEWTERDAASIAVSAMKDLETAYIEHLETLTGRG